jgi:hypothetical protein
MNRTKFKTFNLSGESHAQVVCMQSVDGPLAVSIDMMPCLSPRDARRFGLWLVQAAEFCAKGNRKHLGSEE